VTQHNESIDLIHPPDAHLNQNYLLVAHHIMTQFSTKAGMQQFKERGNKAMTKELSQLHFRDTFKPVNSKELKKQERRQVLESHLFLKVKRDTSVKDQMVAGGYKQRGTIDNQDASSPTAALESVLLTAINDAKEERDVAVIDIPNAFVQTRLVNDEDKAIMRMHGKLAELMVKVAPEIYTKYVTIGQDCTLRSPLECPIRYHESRPTLLPMFCDRPAIDWLRDHSL
jgi:hypothetical protein